MKKTLTKLLVGMAVISAGMTAGVQQASAWVQNSGGNCKAANLNQAERLGWDQFGIYNPAPVGGPFYFVLCPMQRDEDQDGAGFETMSTTVRYIQQAAKNDPNKYVFCTFRDMENGEGDYQGSPGSVIESFTNNSIRTSGCCNNDMDKENWQVQNNGNDLYNAHNMVCRLYPQTYIHGYGMDY